MFGFVYVSVCPASVCKYTYIYIYIYVCVSCVCVCVCVCGCVCMCVCVCLCVNIYLYVYTYIRGEYDKFPDFFSYGHLKLSLTLENSLCYRYTSYEMTDQSLWFQIQMNSNRRNWNTPTKAWLSQLVNFKNAIWHFRKTICNKILF